MTRQRGGGRDLPGLTAEMIDALYADQEGNCAICGRPESSFKRQLAVDHDHATGQVRGLLCVSCNAGIGLLGDDVDRLRSAMAYLEKTRVPRSVIA